MSTLLHVFWECVSFLYENDLFVPRPQIIKYFAPLFLAQWVIWKCATSLHPSCVQIMSLCLWGSDSNGLVITVCLWVYRCIPPPCLHGLWGWQIKITHLFSFPLPKEQLSSHCELPLWSYYKAQYFWSLPEWVQGTNLTWLGLGYTSYTTSHFDLEPKAVN